MSSRELSKISVMLALVKREFQEQRALFVYLPVAVKLLMVLQFTATVVSSYFNEAFFVPFRLMPGGGVRFGALLGEGNGTLIQFATLPTFLRTMLLDDIYAGNSSSLKIYGGSSSLMLLYWAVMAFYFLMTMYQQRKNRSILFWNSMPVSDTQTIVSKVLAGIVGCQAVFLGCLLLQKVIFLLETMAYGSLYPIDVWQTLVEPSHVFSSYFTLLGHAVLTMAWTLPVYAWLLLASAGSRSMPFAWATGPLVLVMLVELILTQTTEIAEIVLMHLMPLQYFSHNQMVAGRLPDTLNMELALSVVLGLVLVYAAIRCNRSEDI